MAKREVNGEAKKPFSSKLMQMKFMQRGASKVKAAEVSEKEQPEAKAESSEEWKSQGKKDMGCVVIMENDPEPGAASGRFSFNAFNPETEHTEVKKEGEKLEKENPGSKSISDAEMSQQLASNPKKQKRHKEKPSQSPAKAQTGPKGRYYL